MRKLFLRTILPLCIALALNFIVDTEFAFGHFQPVLCSLLLLMLACVLLAWKGKCRTYGLCILITFLLSGYLREKVQGPRKVATIQSTQVIIDALEAYKIDHAQYPENIEDLLPKYLAEIPKSKMTVMFKREVFYSRSFEESNYSLHFEMPNWRKVSYWSKEKKWEEHGD